MAHHCKHGAQAPLPFEGLHASSLNQVVYVKHACERELESPPTYVHITEHRKDSVREAITKCLEAPLCSFLKHIRKIFDISEADSRLVEEATSLIKLLKRWDTDFNIPVSQNQQPNYKHGVPREIYDHLSRRRGVNAFGLWRNGNLKVFVEDAMLVDALEAELENIDGVFFRKTKLKILANNITFNICLKQGDEIFRKNDNTTHSSNLGESTSHATIGAFVRNKETFEDIYILTCGHVFPCLDMPAYGKLKEPSVSCKIGSCIFTNPSGIHNFIDFSVVKVDSDNYIKENCELAFMRSEKQKCNAAVYTESLENTMDYVHKKGATTGWTDGRIQCYSFVVKRFGNRDDVFLVLGKGGKFCEPGDSGSIVFAPDNSVDQENVHILGMLMGTVRSLNADDDNDSETTPEATQDKDSRLEERPEEVSEDSEGAFASLGSFDQGDDDNLRRLSRDELAVCFRMDSALNLLKEKKNLEVEFEKVSMSSDESDLF
ncbi:uncharacterized protein LOC134233310 [Saccostrea cucullata]|uniref:uncharacterized protein LOC134233310 n=1 Tax=Saccostrea cuccullata TaxID=36930 RepID=UPI002ED30653